MISKIYPLTERFKDSYIFKGTDICFWPVPKNACTTLNMELYYQRFGMEFNKFSLFGKLIHIHHIYPAKFYNESRFRSYRNVALVRDPYQRFVSMYTNRVLHYKDLSSSKNAILEAGLPLIPDINVFIDNLDFYRKVNRSIFNHSAPQSSFLGTDLSRFDMVEDIKNIDRIRSYINDTTALEIAPFRRTQTGGRNEKKQVLSSISCDNEKIVKEFYSKDYELLSNFDF
ncbi:sulfotransferase family 2 domain-containing protein [Vibrio astriarenae]